MKTTTLERVKIISLGVLSGVLLAGAIPMTVSAAKPDYASAAKPSNVSIVDIVLEDDGEFDVLQAAVIKAGLVGYLDGKKQVTVFAPTDQAFINALGAADEADALSIIDNLDVSDVTAILTYHVIPGRHTSNSVLARSAYKTVGGNTLSKAELVAAGVIPANVSASNGVVHVLSSSVLMP